jgi:hypothetical protein
MLGWDQYGLDKKMPRDTLGKLVVLHLLGYVGYVVHLGPSGE